jgi:hypothetical protein
MALVFAFAVACFRCHSERSEEPPHLPLSLPLLLLLPLQVFVVILSEAKNPDELNAPHPVGALFDQDISLHFDCYLCPVPVGG